jgi:hypothetical protein
MGAVLVIPDYLTIEKAIIFRANVTTTETVQVRGSLLPATAGGC